ncbi:MAG: hypothetical protein Q8O10_01205 [candidate division Zixibacteria bacterium]|nr:hypothetical protein [candidate division Zixibacteria bacterium]
MTKKKKKSQISFPPTKRFGSHPKDVTWSSVSRTQIELPEEEIEEETQEIQRDTSATLLRPTSPDKVTGAEIEGEFPETEQETVGRSLWDIVWYFLKGKRPLLAILLSFFYLLAIGVSGQLRYDTIILHIIITIFIISIVILVGYFSKGAT